eukprot:g7241.t1
MIRNLNSSPKVTIVAKVPTGEKYVKWRDRVRKKALRKRHLLQKHRRISTKPVTVSEPEVLSSDALRWRGQPWKTHQSELLRLQRLIYESTLEHDWSSLESYQDTLIHSIPVKALAVRRICTTHPQRRESGIDGLHSLDETQQRSLVNELTVDGYSDTVLFRTVSRAWKQMRRSREQDIELSFCTIRDRVKHVLVSWALVPQLEALFHTVAIFGHRPGRSVHDLVHWLTPLLTSEKQYLVFTIRIENKAQVVQMMESRLQDLFIKQIRSWCDEGVFSGGLYPAGIGRHGQEQSCPVMPCLGNLICFEVIQCLATELPISSYNGQFIIVYESKSELDEIMVKLGGVLKRLGLKLDDMQTGNEVEILQFQIQRQMIETQCVTRLRIQSSVLERHLENLRTAFLLSESFLEDKTGLINRVNPVIASFVSYFSGLECDKELQEADDVVKKLLMIWSVHNNPMLSTPKAINKEFGGSEDDKVFKFETKISKLQLHISFKRKMIVDEIPLELTPYHKDTSKWTRRLKKWEIDLHPSLVHLQ